MRAFGVVLSILRLLYDWLGIYDLPESHLLVYSVWQPLYESVVALRHALVSYPLDLIHGPERIYLMHLLALIRLSYR